MALPASLTCCRIGCGKPGSRTRRANNSRGAINKIAKVRPQFSYNFLVVARTSPEVIQAFAALVRSEIQDEHVDLLRAALTFARIEDPKIDVESYVRRVEELSRRVAARIQDLDDPAQSIAALNEVLFQ